jgi:GT2 family glycosyltransferase
MNKKIGIGIVTCNRPKFLHKLLSTLQPCLGDKPHNYINEWVIVNDGIPQEKPTEALWATWINNPENLGVAKSKNKILRYLLNQKCDYIFVIEDDVEILDCNIFRKYIQAHELSGIHHFNYGPGSPFNRVQKHIQNFDLHNRHLLDQDTEPNPKMIIQYNQDCEIALYEHTVAMFSFFTAEALQKVGLFPEVYSNCWEHVDHTYQIIKANLHPPFWWFADVANSHKLLKVSDSAIQESAIAKDNEQWMKNVLDGREIYKSRHGHYPNQPPLTSKQEVISVIKTLKSK